MESYDTQDMIYALATAWAKAAIAVIRVSGSGCISSIQASFESKRPLCEYSSSRAVHGMLVDRRDGKNLDEVVITVYRNGRGYTGEESMEISCHGGLETVKSILSYLSSLGMRQARRGEFTLRAFMHGKMDLTRAEAVQELVDSRGNKGRIMALNRLNGALSNRINTIKDIISDIMSLIEVQLDYSEDEIGEDVTFPAEKLDRAIAELESLELSYCAGKLYSQGARVVLCGASNAGKSSLFNLLLKEDRSIVSSEKGTTRDFIESQCTVRSIPIRLYDTAGFRDESSLSGSGLGSVEAEGIRRSRSLVDEADLILYLVDSQEVGKPSFELDRLIADDPRCMGILNKMDLNPVSIDGFLPLSIVTGEGFEDLCLEMERRLTKDIELSSDDALVIENERQRDNLARAKEALLEARACVEANLPLDIVTMNVSEALEALGELTGEVTTEDILDRIFSSFCVGK